MTKKDALTIALSALTASTYANPSFDGKDTTRKEIPADEVRETITKMIAQLSPKSEEAKAKANAARKEKTAKARAELVAHVAPILREGLSHTLIGVTAKELYDLTKSNLPADFTALRVQAILLREMRDELTITEAKGKANTYTLKEGA